MSRILRFLPAALFACVLALSSDAAVRLLTGSYTGSFKNGQTVHLFLYYYNDGATDAHDLALTITADPGLHFASLASVSQGVSCTPNGADLVCTAATIGSHQSFQVDANFSTDPSLPPDYAATLGYRMTVGGVSIGASSVSTYAAGPIDAKIAIAPPPTTIAGLQTSMEATITNDGPTTLYDPVVTVSGAFIEPVSLGSDYLDCENTSPSALRCYFPISLPPGATKKVPFSVYTTAAEKGPGSITATVTPWNDDTAPPNNTAVISVPVTAVADVKAFLDPLNLFTFVGSAAGDAQIHIKSQSSGPSATGRGTLTYDVPVGFTFQSLKSASGSLSCTTPAVGQAGRVTCTDTTAVFDVTVIARAVTAGNYTHTVTVQGEAQDPDLSNNTVSVKTQVLYPPDLTATVTATPAHPKKGDVVTFLVTVKNEGLGRADAAVVMHEYSTGLQYLNGPTVGYLNQMIPLDPGQSTTIQMPFTVTASSGTVWDKVSLYSSVEVNTSNNTARADVDLATLPTDLTVTLNADRTTVAPRGRVNYTAVVRNNGLQPATNVVLTDVVPSGATAAEASITDGTCTTTGGITCRVLYLAAGSALTATFAVDAAATPGVGFNDVSVTSDASDTYPGDNTARMQLMVVEANQDFADLTVAMTASASSIVVGTPFTFDITVRNLGSAAAANVHVVDTLPAGLLPASVPAGCTVTAQRVDCNIPTLGAGASMTLQVGAMMHGTGATTNSAAVSTTSAEPNLANNSASATVSGVLGRARGARH